MTEYIILERSLRFNIVSRKIRALSEKIFQGIIDEKEKKEC